jgi:hypothetical protein
MGRLTARRQYTIPGTDATCMMVAITHGEAADLLALPAVKVLQAKLTAPDGSPFIADDDFAGLSVGQIQQVTNDLLEFSGMGADFVARFRNGSGEAPGVPDSQRGEGVRVDAGNGAGSSGG